MPYLLALSPIHYFFSISLMLTSLFLILIVLVQRGRGGGLTGALGGMGGQSAFGTKAGDLFTRVTIVVATVWILLSIGALKVLNRPDFKHNAAVPLTVPLSKDAGDKQPPTTTMGEGAGASTDESGAPSTSPIVPTVPSPPTTPDPATGPPITPASPAADKTPADKSPADASKK
jgi:preprotein translocase subunit SecG